MSKEIMEFVRAMSHEFPEMKSDDLYELVRLARAHGKLQERACNEQVPPSHDAKCEARIKDVCERIGIKTVLFNGDPRGYTVKIMLPSGRYNTWGGAEDGWGVPQ